MKFCLINASLLVTTFFTSSLAQGGQFLYLSSSKDKAVDSYAVNQTTGELNRKFHVNLPGNAGPLTFSPNTSLVYVAMSGLNDGKAGIATLKRENDGSLTLLATAAITSRSAYIRSDKEGRHLLAAHYSAGNVTVYRIVDGICTDELLDHKKTERTAHCIEIDPSGRFVFVPHTSPNKVYQFRLDGKTSKLIPNDPMFVEGPDENHKYHEPRHYSHHPRLNIGYTSNENGGGITAWRFNPERGTLSRLNTLSTLPPDFDGDSYAADIQITSDGRFAYISNRDETKRKAGESPKDTLTGISLDPRTGEMSVIGYFPTAHHVRSLCIDLTGQFVYSAGTQSSTMFAYRIDQHTGKLDHFATYNTSGTPMWVMCGNVAE